MEWILSNNSQLFSQTGRPYLWAIVLVGLTNGVLFAPASEHIYFLVYAYDGKFSSLGIAFALSNSLGHLLLFMLARAFRKLHIKKRGSGRAFAIFENLLAISESFYNRYDRKYLSVLLLRCVPFYHSAVSIMVSSTNITYKRFVTLTVLGNLLFFVLLNLGFQHFGSKAQPDWMQVSLALVTISVISFFVKRFVDRIFR